AVEFGISGIGYCGLIIVCGRIHDLADQLRLLSLTTAVLRSPAVADLKGALRPWRPAVGERGPPMVERAAASLERVPLAAKTSVVMTALAMILCGVAVANTGAALDAATAVISGLAKVPSKT